MTAAGKITLLEANALADGELTGEAAAEARAALADDDSLRAAVAWRDTLTAQLHEAYDRELYAPLPPRTRRLLSSRWGWKLPVDTRRYAAAAAMAIAAAGIGAIAGAMLNGEPTGMDRVVRMALGAHQVYAGEIRHPVEVPGSDVVHLSKWLGARIGMPFTAPDIADTGFTLVGGRLLAEGPRPAALLMYENAGGQRVTLYMEKWPTTDETALRHLASGGLNTVFWVDKNFACAVSGTIDADKLKVVSEQLYASLERS